MKTSLSHWILSLIIYHSEQLARYLWQATHDGDISKVNTLLEQGANPNHEIYWSDTQEIPNWNGLPPLHTACVNGKLQIAILLVDTGGADFKRGDDLYDQTPLHFACKEGHKPIVVYLVEEAKCDVGKLITSESLSHHAVHRNAIFDYTLWYIIINDHYWDWYVLEKLLWNHLACSFIWWGACRGVEVKVGS